MSAHPSVRSSGIRRTAPTAWSVALLFLGLCAGAFLGACAGEPPKATAVSNAPVRPSGAAITFADVKPIFEKSCTTGCHGPNGTQSGVPFDDVKRVKLVRVEMYRRLTSQDPQIVMPQGNTDFKTTEEGKLLIEWLQAGADVMTEETLVPGGGPVASQSPGSTTPAASGLKVPVLVEDDYAYVAFADVQTIASTACGTCHGPNGVDEAAYTKYPLVTVSDWQTQRNKVLAALKNGSMPKDPAGGPANLVFLNSPDGKKLFGWLQYGQDFTGSP